MARRDCEICCGRGVVRLPRFERSARVVDGPMVPAVLEASFREYGCPECGEFTQADRIAVLDAHTMVDERFYQEARQYAREGAAHALVAAMLERNLISYQEHPVRERFGGRKAIVATVGVVSPGTVVTMEERLRERQGQIARASADEAIRQINNWGSYFCRETLRKDEAAQFIREAVVKVEQSWSRTGAIVAKAEGQG